jgi:hypothetical protein
MEAKINKLAEMVETKNARLSMVSEDENLSELIDKKAMNEMRREIKEIERAKLKLEKLYEKMSGGKKKEVVKEEDPVDEGHSMYDEDGSMEEAHHPTEEDSLEEGNIDYDSGPKGFLKKKPNNWLTEKEEDIKEEDIDEMHCSEEDDIVKEETNEEINRWQKLAGL